MSADASDPTSAGESPDAITSRWLRAVAGALGIDDADLTDAAAATALLDLARDAAHGVARPAAPLAAYAVGLAVGRGAPLAESIARATAAAGAWQEA
jgi:hypothetical protein